MTTQPKETTVGDKVAANIRGVLSTHVDMSEHVMCCQVWRDGPGHIDHVAEELLAALAVRPVAAQERIDARVQTIRDCATWVRKIVGADDDPDDLTRVGMLEAAQELDDYADWAARRALTGDAKPLPCYVEDGRTVHRGACGEGPCGDASPTEPGCCECCQGLGADHGCEGPCWDCRGTGHTHDGPCRDASPTCSTPGCPGDPNYAPPGRSHIEGCTGMFGDASPTEPATGLPEAETPGTDW